MKSLVDFLAEVMSRAGRWKDRSIAAWSSDAGLLICFHMNWIMSLVVRTRLPKLGIKGFIPGTWLARDDIAWVLAPSAVDGGIGNRTALSQSLLTCGSRNVETSMDRVSTSYWAAVMNNFPNLIRKNSRTRGCLRSSNRRRGDCCWIQSACVAACNFVTCWDTSQDAVGCRICLKYSSEGVFRLLGPPCDDVDFLFVLGLYKSRSSWAT